MFEMSMQPEMGARVTPALLNLAQMLTLPMLELHQLIEQELAENPALEEVEAADTRCSDCGGPMVGGLCLRCVGYDSVGEGGLSAGGEEIDVLLFVAAPRSLSESLLRDLYASLPTQDHVIAMTLVGSLDDHGFLTEELELVASALGVSIERVQVVWRRLCDLGPPGIATRDTRECLLAQIDTLEAQGVSCPYVRALVAHHLEDLGAGRFRHLVRTLKITSDEFDAARAFIRRQLWPYPMQAAGGEAAPLQRTRYRIADIVFSRHNDAFTVEVPHAQRRILRLSPLYKDLSRRAATLDDHERAHVQTYIARARVFLTNLLQREHTLKRIGESLIVRQRAFLLHGVRDLAPLTRSEIATELNLHESTVSRAIAEKSALLPNGALMAISEFFVVARGVQDILRELVANETCPLSDERLSQLLALQGHPIARRTVAKYRDIMRIPPSHMR
jgi:RNA polymerase sigma-54 factor